MNEGVLEVASLSIFLLFTLFKKKLFYILHAKFSFAEIRGLLKTELSAVGANLWGLWAKF